MRRVYGLFQDQGRSTQFLKDYQSEFMFDEGGAAEEDDMEEDAACVHNCFFLCRKNHR